MTTQVHIVNFGPDGIEVVPMNKSTRQSVDPVLRAESFINPHQSRDFYVHDGQYLEIREKKL